MARTVPETREYPVPKTDTSEILLRLSLAVQACLDLVARVQAGFFGGRKSLGIKWCEGAPFEPEIRQRPAPE